MNNKLIKHMTEQANSCTRCDLYKMCKHKILGMGDYNARIMFIGEAPGIAEDNTGIPFAGKEEVLSSKCITCKYFSQCFSNFINRIPIKMSCTYLEAKSDEVEYNKEQANKIDNAGNVFNILLDKVGLKRNMIYITNIVACRPVKDGYKNGKPTTDQINSCIGRVKLLLKNIKPDAIVFVGSLAAKTMAEVTEAMYKIVGKIMEFNVENAKYVSTFIYHPASLLYNNRGNYDAYMDRNVSALKSVISGIDNNTLWSNE